MRIVLRRHHSVRIGAKILAVRKATVRPVQTDRDGRKDATLTTERRRVPTATAPAVRCWAIV